MPDAANSIAIEGNGNITIQDVDHSHITIHTHNPEEVLKELQQLSRAQLDSLLQVAEKQTEHLSGLFRTLLNGVAQEKNVVKGSLSNIGTAVLGDGNTIHYHYHTAEAKLPKELSLHIPRIHPDDIIGRKQDLEALHAMLNTDQRMVVVNGLGGIGKTTLAQAYVGRYYEQYAHIAWLTQSSENIATDFLNEGGLVRNLAVETANLEPEQVFQEIVRKLKGIAEKPNLLVIDNGEQSLSKYRSLLPGQPLWHLLVTSREEISGFHPLPLDFLSEEQAMALFRKHYSPLRKLTEQEIKELVQTVDYHTLTIEILAKTARVQRYDASALKAAIGQDLRANVAVAREAEQVEKVGTYLSTVFSLSKLTKAEVWLLKQFACLPPDFHSFDLLEGLLVDEGSVYRGTFSETLSGLTRRGWLLYNSSTDSYKMHRIIAEVVKKEQLISVADVQRLIVVLTQELKVDQNKDNLIDKFGLSPYGKSLLVIFEEDSSREIAALQNNLALVLKDLGEYGQARELLERAVASNEKNFSLDHPSKTTGYSNLAMVLKDLGEYKKALELLEKVVVADEWNFGPDYPSTANSYSNLATVLQDLGEYGQARELLEKAAAANERNFGPDHPSTVRSYSNLSMVLKDLGEYNKALELLEKVVVANERNFGPYHPSTVRSYSNLATVLQELGEYERAKELLEKAAAAEEWNFGPDHPRVVRSYSNLATVLQELGEYGRARELLEKAAAIDERNLGPNHPSTIKSYSNLATVLQDLGKFEKAKELLEKSVSADERNFGLYHPSTATGYSILSTLLRDMGEYYKALELSAKALTVFKMTLPGWCIQVVV